MKELFKEYLNKMEHEIKNPAFRFDFIARFVVIWTLVTRIPLPKRMWPKTLPEGKRVLTVIPLAGGILGLFTGVLITAVNILGIGQIGSVWIGAAFYAMAGWSLHLDGWGDLWDGIGSGKSGEKMREIMKDSRVGSYGVTALIIAFGLWTGLLLSLGQHQEAAALMVAGGVGRFGTCVAAFYGNSPWPEGMAKGWVDGFDGYELFTALVCTLVLLPFAPFEWLLSLILVSLFALCTAQRMNNKLGGVNGDVLGAVAVAGELISLAVFAL